MNPEERMRLADQVLKQAWEFRGQPDADVLPTWFLHDAVTGLQIIGTPFFEDAPKSAYGQVIAQMVRDSGHADFVLFVSDAWVRSVPADASEEEMRKRPSQSPDRQEALTVQCWHRDGTGFTLLRMYRQADDGALEILEEKCVLGDPETETFAAVVEAVRS